MQNRTGDEMGFGAKKLQRHQRAGTVRKHICRSANVLDHGSQVGGLSGKIIAAVCRIAAATTAAAVVGNYAVVATELTCDAVEKCAVDTSAVHAHQGRSIRRHIRAGIFATGNRGARILDRKIHVVPPSSTPIQLRVSTAG